MAKKIKKDTIVTVVGLIVTVCAFAGAIVAVTKMISKPKDETVTTTYSKQNNKASTLYFDGKNYKIKENMEVVLIMGIDDREDLGNTKFAINNSQADVLYVFAVDHKNKTFQAIQINRETMTGIQTYNNDGTKDTIAEAQICLAHSFGKTEQGRCLNTVDAVSGLLFNMPVDHYISLNMAAISILNEQVGGVTVTVPAGLESADPAFKEGLAYFVHEFDGRVRYIHSTGHADKATLAKFIQDIAPRKYIVPFHTEDAEGFKSLDIEEKYKDMIILPNDGDMIEIA